jgi:hypothetical protein
MYCYILITVQQEEDSNTVHTWHSSICKLESPSSDTVIRMEQYIPDTPAYVNWNSLLVILWSEWNSTYLTPLHMKLGILFLWYCHRVRYVLFHSDHSITRRGSQPADAVVSGMYCSILITVSQEGDSNLHMQGCRFCDQNGTVHTWHPCICKLGSSSCDTVIRMEQYIPDTTAYVSWNPLLIPTCICKGVRYVLFHSDHSITRRGFQRTHAVVSGMYCSILITVSQEEDSNLQLESSSCDTAIRMEQYIPDTPAYASWDPLLVIQRHM